MPTPTWGKCKWARLLWGGEGCLDDDQMPPSGLPTPELTVPDQTLATHNRSARVFDPVQAVVNSAVRAGSVEATTVVQARVDVWRRKIVTTRGNDPRKKCESFGSAPLFGPRPDV